MEQVSKYEQQALDFLNRFGLEFRAVLVGDDCPARCEDAANDKDMDAVNTFPRKTHIHGKHYRCTISGQGRGHVGFDYWNSYAEEEENYYIRGKAMGVGHGFGFENVYWDKYRAGKYPAGPRHRKPLQPTAYDLLACITKSDPGTFDDFCGDFGYDTDSRKGEETYHAVVREWKKVRKFFTDTELAEMQEIS